MTEPLLFFMLGAGLIITAIFFAGGVHESNRIG
jgi:hypothetical protein